MRVYKNFETGEEITFSSREAYFQWSNNQSIDTVMKFHLVSFDKLYPENEQPELWIIDRIQFPSKDPKKLKKQIDFINCWDRLKLLKKEFNTYILNGQYGDAQDRQKDIEILYRKHPALRYKIS